MYLLLKIIVAFPNFCFANYFKEYFDYIDHVRVTVYILL